VPVAADEEQRVLFSAKVAELQLRLQDSSGAPLSKRTYTISWRDTEGVPSLGATDGDGVLKEPIPQGAAIAEVVVGEMTDMSIVIPNWTFLVRVTPLPSADTLAGAAARLSNLGYLIVPLTVPLAVPDFVEWARTNDEAGKFATMTYYRTKQIDPPVSYGEVYAAIGRDHDGK
jgi:hypothetical protein